MSSSVFDFKAINTRCREISRHTLGEKPYCATCTNRGWVLLPDPRVGFDPQPVECPVCRNRNGYPCPFLRPVDHDYDPTQDPDPLIGQKQGQQAAQANKPFPAAPPNTRFPSKKGI